MIRPAPEPHQGSPTSAPDRTRRAEQCNAMSQYDSRVGRRCTTGPSPSQRTPSRRQCVEWEWRLSKSIKTCAKRCAPCHISDSGDERTTRATRGVRNGDRPRGRFGRHPSPGDGREPAVQRRYETAVTAQRRADVHRCGPGTSPCRTGCGAVGEDTASTDSDLFLDRTGMDGGRVLVLAGKQCGDGEGADRQHDRRDQAGV